MYFQVLYYCYRVTYIFAFESSLLFLFARWESIVTMDLAFRIKFHCGPPGDTNIRRYGSISFRTLAVFGKGRRVLYN